MIGIKKLTLPVSIPNIKVVDVPTICVDTPRSKHHNASPSTPRATTTPTVPTAEPHQQQQQYNNSHSHSNNNNNSTNVTTQNSNSSKTNQNGNGSSHPIGGFLFQSLPFRLAPNAEPKTPWDEVFETEELDIQKAEPVFIEELDPINKYYELKEELGRGSYGTVYTARERSSGREVAVKEIRKGEGSCMLSDCKLQQEVEVLGDLKGCKNNIQLHGCYHGHNKMYIVTELCRGGDLLSYLKTNGPLNEHQAAQVAIEALKLLRDCHEKRIVHGDVKAANFVIANRIEYQMFKRQWTPLPDGWLKGIDFGTSQHTGRGRIANKVGTPTHWAPEVFAGNYYTEADMWSLGVCLYQLMTGRLPFWDKYEEANLRSERDILRGVIYTSPDFSGEPWNNVSRECIDFIKGLLNKNYQTRLTADTALKHPFIENSKRWWSPKEKKSGNERKSFIPCATSS